MNEKELRSAVAPSPAAQTPSCAAAGAVGEVSLPRRKLVRQRGVACGCDEGARGADRRFEPSHAHE